MDITGSVQNQVGWSLEQPHVVKDVPARSRQVGPDDPCRSLQPQSFCDSVICGKLSSVGNAGAGCKEILCTQPYAACTSKDLAFHMTNKNSVYYTESLKGASKLSD